MPDAVSVDETARDLARKQAVLQDLLKTIAAGGPSGGDPGGTLAVAYSGGLDSRFVIHCARRAGLDVRALHIRGPHIPAHEQGYAVQWAQSAGVPLTVIERDPLSLPELRRNPADRCYHCKKTVFSALLDAARGLPLCDGTNASDLGEYRPGLRALAELGIRSPLAETGIRKQDIRAMGRETGLENPDQAAQPCLLTRFGYGEALTPERLTAVDAAEDAVRRTLAALGQPDRPFRVRYEDARAAALHLTGEPLDAGAAQAVVDALAKAGFPGIAVRLMDSLSGYFDRA